MEMIDWDDQDSEIIGFLKQSWLQTPLRWEKQAQTYLWPGHSAPWWLSTRLFKLRCFNTCVGFTLPRFQWANTSVPLVLRLVPLSKREVVTNLSHRRHLLCWKHEDRTWSWSWTRTRPWWLLFRFWIRVRNNSTLWSHDLIPGWESELGLVFQPPSGLSCYHRDHQGPVDLAQGLITDPGPQGLDRWADFHHNHTKWWDKLETSSDWERERKQVTAWGDQDLSL